MQSLRKPECKYLIVEFTQIILNQVCEFKLEITHEGCAAKWSTNRRRGLGGRGTIFQSLGNIKYLFTHITGAKGSERTQRTVRETKT